MSVVTTTAVNITKVISYIVPLLTIAIPIMILVWLGWKPSSMKDPSHDQKKWLIIVSWIELGIIALSYLIILTFMILRK